MKRRSGQSLALRAVLCAGVVALAGCDFAPRYATPEIAAPEKFKDSAPSGLRAPLTEDWWRNFHDRELDRLEALIETDNPDYAAALARYERAKAFLDLANSGFFPSIVGLPELSYNKQSANASAALEGTADLLRRQSVIRPTGLGGRYLGPGSGRGRNRQGWRPGQ